MVIIWVTRPCFSLPWTEGASRTTLPRTPRSAEATTAFSVTPRATKALAGASVSRAGWTCETIMVPEAMTNGLSEPSSASIIAVTASRSASMFWAKIEKS